MYKKDYSQWWKRGLVPKKVTFTLLLVVCFYLWFFGNLAFAKSLYVIGNINAAPTPILSYDIQGTSLVYQTTNHIPYAGGGAVGISIDSSSSTLFVTYEFTNIIQLVDAKTMTDVGTTTAPGASDLAGIVVDQGNRKVYTVDRSTSKLYVYNWIAWSNTLSLVEGAPFSLAGLVGAFGIALDETNHILYVADYNSNVVRFYDTSDWALKGSFTVSHRPIGIAINVGKQLVYTGSGWGSGRLLSQYNLTTKTEKTVDLSPAGIMGIAIDPTTDLVYLTTGYSNDNVRVFDSNLTELWSSSDIGDPTGLCVPGVDISYNPLSCKIESPVGNRPVAPNDTLRYRIGFNNPTSSVVTGTEVVNPIPNGTAYVSATGPFTYDAQNQIVRWDFGSMAPGESFYVDLTVKVTASPGDQVINRVTISTDEYLATTKEYITYVTDNPDQKRSISVGETADLPLPVANNEFGTLYAINASGELVPPTFDASLPTFLISHGWNNDGVDHMPDWQIKMGKAIKSKVEANVFLWDWHIQAMSDHEASIIVDETWLVFDEKDDIQRIVGVPYTKVPSSGKYLARALERIISSDYKGEINLIGFSLGTGVITRAAQNIGNAFRENIRKNIKHLTFLDSPWYSSYPAGTFLYEIKDSIFFDNYWSALGRFQGYKPKAIGGVADTNVRLCNLKLFEDLSLTSAHGYAKEWYRSSVSKFEHKDILKDSDVPDPNEITYGFSWWESQNQQDVSPYYSHVLGDPRWKIVPGYWLENQLLDTYEWVEGEVIYAAGVLEGWSEEKKEQLLDFAEMTGKKIKVLEAKTFEKAADATEFTSNIDDHAVWVYNTAKGLIYGVLKLTIGSQAIVSTEIYIPDVANAMRFSYKFLVGDSGGVLEAFIEDLQVYVAFSDDYSGKGWQNSDWINISALAGQQVKLSFRLSNPDDGMQGAVNLDDIIFAKIKHSGDTDAPTANAGPDQTVEEEDTVTLDGSNSYDPDDGIALYKWTQTAGPTVTLSDDAAVHPTFIAASVDTKGATVTFQLAVVDEGSLADTDEVSVTVKNKEEREDGEGGGGGGCFITTAICDLSMELGFSPVVTLALAALLISFGAGITVKRKRTRPKA